MRCLTEDVCLLSSALVGLGRFELPTSPLSGVRSNQLSYRPMSGGAMRDRTADLLRARQALSQLSYSPVTWIFRINRSMKTKVWAPEAVCHFAFKEVIQPQVPLGLPCYDFTPVMNHSVVIAPPKVRLTTSGATHSHGVTGGVYKARERIHRGMLIHDY